MHEHETHDPKLFIEALRQFHEAPEDQRGDLANLLADAIVTKRVDLAAVRQALMDAGDVALGESLDQLMDLIEPYIEEGGVEE